MIISIHFYVKKQASVPPYSGLINMKKTSILRFRGIPAPYTNPAASSRQYTISRRLQARVTHT